ncbi:hypothetical protein TrVE_jg5549 [Triparma verrucosa]|uniref:Protein kinase domain-containing protein n=1 Tax=Triparma verrucosa TaxID=1606542 RepID=A0A9W7BSM7_9STRA|nr:hypothetical protein TrVE_jg5549 [Triparma verrucosa]
MPIPDLSYSDSFLDHSPSFYTESEMSILNTVCTLLDSASKITLTPIKSPDVSVNLYCSKGDASETFKRCDYKWWSSSGREAPKRMYVGASTFLVPPSYILAFCCDYMNKQRIQMNKTSDIHRCIVQQNSSHSFTSFNRRWLPKPFLHRDFLSSHIWKRLDDKRIIYAIYDNPDDPYPPKMDIGCEFKKGGSCRAYSFAALLIESTVGDDSDFNEVFHNCKCRLVVDVDPGGTMPKHMRSTASHRALGFLCELNTFFNSHKDEIQSHREACDIDGAWKNEAVILDRPRGRGFLYQQHARRITDVGGRTKVRNKRTAVNQFVDFVGDELMKDQRRAKATIFDPMLPTKKGWPLQSYFKNLEFENSDAETQFEAFQIRERQQRGAIEGPFNIKVAVLIAALSSQHFYSESSPNFKLQFILNICLLLVPIVAASMIFKDSYKSEDIEKWRNVEITLTICSVVPMIHYYIALEMLGLESAHRSGALGHWGIPVILAIAMMTEATLLVRLISLMSRVHVVRLLPCIHACMCVYALTASPLLKSFDLDPELTQQHRTRFFASMNVFFVVLFSLCKYVDRRRRSLFSHYWFLHSAPFLHKQEMMSRFILDKRSIAVVQKVLDQVKGRAVRKQLADLLKVQINYSDLAYIREVGRGGNGVVFAASYRNQIVAVKQILPERISAENIMSLIGEMQFGIMLNHPNIIKTIGCCLTEPHICCVLELANEGSLRQKMRRDGTLDWLNGKRNFASDILAGMCYLHERETPIIHRDLKSGNVLITEWQVAKISDFGSSRVMPKDLDDLSVEVGTKFFMAPEVMNGERYGTPSDVYSFGCLLADMAMQGKVKELYMRGEDAPKNPLEFMNKIVSGWRPQLPKKWRVEMNVLYASIQDCWQPIPEERPSFRELYARFQAWDGELDISNEEESLVLRHLNPYTAYENQFVSEGYEYILGVIERRTSSSNQKPSNLFEAVINSKWDEIYLPGASHLLTNPIGPEGKANGCLSRTMPFQAHEVMDYLIDWASPFKVHLKCDVQKTEVARRIKHYYNDHHQIFQLVKVLGGVLKNRELIMRSIWKKLSQGVYILWNKSCDHVSCPPGDHGSVRMTGKSAVLVQDIPGGNSCHVTYSFDIEAFGGAVSVPMVFRNFLNSTPMKKYPVANFLLEIEVFLRLKRGENRSEIESKLEGGVAADPLNCYVEAYKYHQMVLRGEIESNEDYQHERLRTKEDPLSAMESGNSTTLLEKVEPKTTVIGSHTNDQFYTVYKNDKEAEDTEDAINEEMPWVSNTKKSSRRGKSYRKVHSGAGFAGFK